MGLRGGGTEGHRESYMAWGKHIVGEKTLALGGVPASPLQVPEWRQAFDATWYGFYNAHNTPKPDFDLAAAQDEREQLRQRRLAGNTQILVTPEVLTANNTGGDWDAQRALLREAAELADAGKLRVARNGLDRAITGMYSFSIFDFDEMYATMSGDSRTLYYEGPAGGEVYPIGSHPVNSEMARTCEAGFDYGWLASGIDIVYGLEAHRGVDPAALEPADEVSIIQRTTTYIGELVAAGGWGS